MTSKHDNSVRETAPAYPSSPDPNILQGLVERIVRAARPERIILFGSGAAGQMGPNSDLDVLVVKPGEYRRIDVMHAIRRELRGLGVAVDLVVATPGEMAEFGERVGLVHSAAVRHGREIYTS